MSLIHKLAVVGCLAGSLATGTARANTITVSFGGADGVADAHCTFSEAITGGFTECAPTGPPGPLVIALPAGTRRWTATDGLRPAPITSDVIIRGAGAAATILSASQAGMLPLLEITGGSVTIEGVAFEGWTGSGPFGGGVIRQRTNTTLVVRDCAFRDNDAGNRSGGAISSGDDSGAHSTSLRIERTTFARNGGFYAGALFAGGATVAIVDSVFTANEAEQVGGAVRIISTGATQVATITGSTFTANTTRHPTDGNGGAMTLEGPGTFTVENTTFTANSSPGYGALWINSPSATVDTCRFEGNVARTASGGALVVDLGVVVRDSVFIGNSAASAGGALSCQGTGIECLIERTRFEKNVCGGSGGAILGVTSRLTVRDSVFFDNSAGLFALTLVAADNQATEGADTGRFVLDRRTFASAIRHQGPGRISGSCFLGATGHIVMGGVDARSNFWTTSDATVRGEWGADTSEALAAAPAGCDPSRTPTTGTGTIAATYEGNATPGTDYVALPSPVVVPPGVSTLALDVVALSDAITDDRESVRLVLGDPNSNFFANAAVTILDGVATVSDVRIAKTVDRATARVGDVLTYTLTVASEGPDAASNIVVTDTLPAGLRLVGVDFMPLAGTTITCAPTAPVSCTLSTLAPTRSVTLTVRARAEAAGEIVNRAGVSAASDTNAANDTAEAVVMVRTATSPEPSPSPSMSPSPVPPVDAGGCGCSTRGPAGTLGWLAFILVMSTARRARRMARQTAR